MRLLLAAPALRLQLACSGPLYLSRRSLCPRSHAWPRMTGRWQRVYEHLRSAICCSPSPAVVKIHCVSRVLGLHISRRQAGRRTPRHNQRRPAQPQAPRTRRHDRPHARLAPGDDRRMEREASRSGRRRRQTPEKQVTGIRGCFEPTTCGLGDRRSTSGANQAVYAAFGTPRQSADGTPAAATEIVCTSTLTTVRAVR